jgi:uncharacterized membrane protein
MVLENITNLGQKRSVIEGIGIYVISVIGLIIFSIIIDMIVGFTSGLGALATVDFVIKFLAAAVPGILIVRAKNLDAKYYLVVVLCIILNMLTFILGMIGIALLTMKSPETNEIFYTPEGANTEYTH